MNSFKKIALGLVAAMTLGTIVATPASANTVSLAVTTANSGSGTAAAPYVIKVPFDNVVSDTSTVGSEEALTVVATVVAGTPVTFTTTGNAKIVSALGATVTSASGVTSLTVTPASTTATVYVFTTSTSASALTASVTGAATTVYLKGAVGPAYNLKMTVPANGGIASKVTATFEVSDIFGNAKSGETITVTALGGVTAGSVTADALVTGKYSADLTLPATAGTVAVGASITAPTAVPTLATAVTSQTAIVTVSDLAGALALANAALAAEKAASAAALAAEKAAAAKALADAKAASDAEILALKAEVVTLKADAVTAKVASDKAISDAKAAAKVELDAVKAENAKALADSNAAIAAMKKAFNDLAKKWNKKNPSAKVTLVK